MGYLVDVILQAIVLISIVVVVSHATDNVPNVPEGILAALAEEAHTPVSVIVITILSIIAVGGNTKPAATRPAVKDQFDVDVEALRTRT